MRINSEATKARFIRFEPVRSGPPPRTGGRHDKSGLNDTGTAGTVAASIAVLLSLARPGLAAEPPERPYNPSVGSRWIIESETQSDNIRPDGPRSSLTKLHAEMTIDEKLPDGFRITYVNRGATVEGNEPMVPLFRSAVKALENVPIRATTDLSGKPVRIDNLDQAKAAMRNMLDNLTAPFKDKPQLQAVLT